MERSRLDLILGVVAIAALAFAAWMYASNRSLHHDLKNAQAARRVFETTALERVTAAEDAKAAAETAITELKAIMAETEKANAAALKQIQDRLTTTEGAKETAEEKLKAANDQLKTAKDEAAAAVAKAKDELDHERAARQAAEQALHASPAPPPPTEAPQQQVPSP